MGVQRRTVENVWVYKIEPARGLMWVKGQVSAPGSGALIGIRIQISQWNRLRCGCIASLQQSDVGISFGFVFTL